MNLPLNGEEITFRRVTSANVSEICELSEILPDDQREFVAETRTVPA
jgi:diamine N-acetyltransferase